MKNIIKLFRPVIIPLVICLVVSQLPLSPAYAEENITITTYYPSPSGSYLDLNVQGTLLVGTGTPASGVSSRIEFSHNTSSSRSHWNIDQAAPSGSTSNNTTNPRLRFFTEPNNNANGYERLVLDNTSLTFRDNSGRSMLEIGTVSGVQGNLILSASNLSNDVGDIIFRSASGTQKGRIWTKSNNSSSGLYLSSGDNSEDIAIDSDGVVTVRRLNMDSLGEIDSDPDTNDPGWVGFVNRIWLTLVAEIAIIAAIVAFIESISSIAYKENVVTIDNALEKVMQLRGVYFNWKKDYKPEDRSRKIGLIIEEVKPVIPEVIIPASKDGKMPEMLAYHNLVALLVEAIKEQQGEIKKQQEEILELKQRMDKISSPR
jgi:hypothetical protein